MKIRVNKKVIGHFLEYSWVFIIAFGFFSYTVFYYPIHKINEYKSYEKIVFFSEAGFFKEKDFEDKILERFQDEILQVTVYDYSSKEPYLGTLYESYGARSDFLILSEKNLLTVDKFISDNFINLDDNFLKSNDNNYDYFTYDTLKYGLKVYDYENSDYNEKYKFLDWIEFDGNDNYYLLANKKSVNFNLNEEEKTTDNGYQVFDYLMERYGK